MSVTKQAPLQVRLIATIAVALLMTAGLGVVPIYWHIKSKVETEMVAALAVGEQVARNGIETNLASPNLPRRLRLMVDHFNGDRHLRVSLIGSDNRVSARSRLAPPEKTAPNWFRNFIQAEPRTSRIKLDQSARPLEAVEIVADPTNEVSEAWEDFVHFARILGLFCVLVLASVFWIVVRALAPIRSILDGYSEIAAGNLTSRVTPSGSPELEKLCHGFNEMSDALEQMEARNARLTQQLEDVQEEERADLARDLHDEVSPLLFAADVDAAMLSKKAQGDGRADMLAQTDAIRSALKQLKKTVTHILGRLRPAVLLDQGLPVAVDNLVSGHMRRHPKVSFDVQVADVDAPLSVLSVVFFVIREALANALRHGNPKVVTISVTQQKSDTILVRVSDNGRGLPDQGLQPGFGLRGMSERVESLGGNLAVRANSSSSGVYLEAVIPLSNAPGTLEDHETDGPDQLGLAERRSQETTVPL